MTSRTPRSPIALVAVLALVACGCGLGRGSAIAPGAAGNAAAREDTASTPAPLRVGTSGDYVPFSVRGADGDFDGFDVAVARAYARDRGRALVLVPFRWPELAARLSGGDFAVAMSGITVRPERLLVGTMTATVAHAEAVLVARRDARPAAHAPAPAPPSEWNRPERRIGVNRGGHLERVARTRFPRATIVTTDDNRSLPALLASGGVDAIVTDSLELASLAGDRRDGEPRDLTIVARLGSDRKAYWVAPGEEPLAADLDGWLRAREEDGSLAALRARHLGTAAGGALAPGADRVVDLVARRLRLMPLVAVAKRRAGLPLEDRAREAAVEARAGSAASAAGLEADAYRAVVRAEIAAAKTLQRATLRASAAPSLAPTPADTSPPASAGMGELRAAIDRLDGALVAALAAAAPLAASGVTARALVDALHSDVGELLGATGRRDDAPLRAIATALLRVRPRAATVATGQAGGRRWGVGPRRGTH
jgi:cyclohexadienyl dehydratase